MKKEHNNNNSNNKTMMMINCKEKKNKKFTVNLANQVESQSRAKTVIIFYV